MLRSAWVAFLNLGIFALSVCVLAGCRTSMEKNYSIVNWHRETLDLIWGEDCGNVTADFIPDLYRFGVSGTCKTLNGKTSCKSRFPPSLNLAAAILEDLEAADSADLPEGDAAIIQSCREIIDKNIDHSTAYRLGIAMVSFLLVSSVVLNILSVAVSFIAEDAWGFWPTAILTLDALSLFLSLVMCVAVMNYEGGGYLSSLHGGEFSDRKLLGIAVWMLLAMLITRVLSNVWLIIGALAILLPIVLVFVLFLVRTRGFFAAFG